VIIPRYEIRETAYAEGKGVYLLESVKKGQVVVAPDQINRIYNQQEREGFLPGTIEDDGCVRWFENYYTSSPDWPDDCYINHSFTPTALWHLGFLFALEDLPAETEVTMDYRLIVGDGEVLPFADAAPGREIVGLNWEENLRFTTQALMRLVSRN
jgi:hypothetical protein